MQFSLEQIEDKIEFFEASNIQTLEKKIQEKIDHNRAIMLAVHRVSHQVALDSKTGQPYFTAVVHFKNKNN
ncbi:transcriptional regulator [Bacillus mesophilus]|uniref:YrzA family protein n=1 Tax=Bacillus mesophilus TaxID=1808955 RepID=A0A6M0Q609_9BACI|nr:YrzA family protein [Bacillus mesophilus]MBM7660731.1 transcriptional regulator [Bacillus mesophilus]NEY71723.1 YrzA family protein [Bacillus mesophilus]